MLQQTRNVKLVNKFVETESRCRSGNWLKREEKCEIKVLDTKLKQAESLHGAQEGPVNRRHGKRQRRTHSRRTSRKIPGTLSYPMKQHDNSSWSHGKQMADLFSAAIEPDRPQTRNPGTVEHKDEANQSENKGLTRFRRSKQ